MVSYQRWINLSYLVFSALLWLFFRHVAELVWGLAKLRAPADVILAPTDWIALGLAGICFVVLMRHRRLNEFMGEVAQELSKVTWPPLRESVMSAGVIAVLIGVISLILVGFDAIWQRLIGLILFKL